MNPNYANFGRRSAAPSGATELTRPVVQKSILTALPEPSASAGGLSVSR